MFATSSVNNEPVIHADDARFGVRSAARHAHQRVPRVGHLRDLGSEVDLGLLKVAKERPYMMRR